MKYSEQIDGFLTFLRSVAECYSMAVTDENCANDETQDILHCIELDDNRYHDYAKLSMALREVRRKRRVAKDELMQLQPIREWMEENAKAIKSLERALGATRKAERNTEARWYNQKTEIVSETLGRNGR